MREPPLILVVDDNEALRDNLVECLEHEGYRVESARDAETALARMERAPVPGVVIMDLLMPGMDGRALAAALRAEPRWRGVRLVLITGSEIRPRVADVDAVLPKPFGIRELLSTIEGLPGAEAR